MGEQLYVLRKHELATTSLSFDDRVFKQQDTCYSSLSHVTGTHFRTFRPSQMLSLCLIYSFFSLSFFKDRS